MPEVHKLAARRRWVLASIIRGNISPLGCFTVTHQDISTTRFIHPWLMQPSRAELSSDL